METPDWVRDAVFYQIFPDRFAASAKVPKPAHLEAWEAAPTLFGFKGGDLEGIRERLDYLTDLGVNALYLTPVFASTANHRYHTYDYLTVDPILGGNDALARLIADAHKRKMRVVLDGVFNHASRGFFQFNHTLENGLASPYLDWFHFNRSWLASGRPIDAYATLPVIHQAPIAEKSLNTYGFRAWWDIPALPKFNTANSEVREFLWTVGERWIDFGIDGWRLDVPNEIDDDDFWREFRRRVKAKNPDAYLVGEIWDDARRWLRGDQFDGVMNYLLGKACLGFCLGGSLNRPQLEKCGYQDVRPLDAGQFASALTDVWERYPRAASECQLNLVGSHDTPRIVNLGLGDESGVRLIFLSLFTVPGAPCVYYGDEIGMAGNHDPDCRRGFEWDQALWSHEMRRHVQRCIRLRLDCRPLRRGDFKVLAAADGVVVYARRDGNDEAIVALNAATTERTIRVPLAEAGLRGREYKERWLSPTAVRPENGFLSLKVPARDARVLSSS